MNTSEEQERPAGDPAREPEGTDFEQEPTPERSDQMPEEAPEQQVPDDEDTGD